MLFSEMFPDELDAALSMPGAGGVGRIAVLPVGSVEQHGPHLLLGCDGYITQVLADMTAKKVQGVLFPMLPFSWIGGLRPFAGTIDMRPMLTGEYMEAVAVEILRQGFARLVIVNCHGGGREMVFSVARRVFKRTEKPVICEYPTFIYDHWPELVDVWKENGAEFDWSIAETSELTGALRYLGRDDLAARVLKNTGDAVLEIGEGLQMPVIPGLEEAFKLSEVGHDYHHECQHVLPLPNVAPEAALAALDFMADKLAWGALNAE